MPLTLYAGAIGLDRRLRLVAGSVVCGILLWHVLSTWLIVSIILPPPLVVAAAFAENMASGIIPGAFWITFLRVLGGFALGSAVGVVAGLAMGSIPLVRRLLEPYVNFFRFITPVAWASPAVIWFGFGSLPIVFLIFYTTVSIVLLNVLAGVLRIHRDRMRMAQVFGAGGWSLFLHIVIPSSVSYALTGMRIALGNSFASGISAEILIGNSGLGYLIYNARLSFAADLMFGCIALLGVTGYFTDRLFRLMQQRVFSRYAVGR